jgi:DNA-binding MarR family transcriptional regulator
MREIQAVSARDDDIESETHHPTRRKLLVCLTGPRGELSKSELAEQVFGRSDGSTRAMITRMTAALVAAGVIEERLAGRERRVRLSPEGRALVDRWSRSSGAPAAADLDAALDAALDASPPRQHTKDRPRFHLRHGALLALSSMRRRGVAGSADEHYQEVLVRLVDERNEPDADLDEFYRLQRTWPSHDHRRILLAECLVRFQSEEIRRSSPPDFSLISDLLDPDDADTVLWASGAIDMAHHYLLEPRNHLDRVAARGLLHTATRLMQASCKIPELAVASAYRLAKAARVAAGGWSWQGPVPAPSPATDPPDRLAQEIADADRIVLQSAAFNQVLDRFDRTLTKHIGPWIMRVMPSAEGFFRAGGGPGLVSALEQWARSQAGQLADGLTGRGRSDPTVRRELEAFLRDGEPYLTTRFSKLVRPHLNQARALLGVSPIAPGEVADVSPSETPYSALLLNNYWTPEMVASDVIVARTSIEEPV